jgi:hypothetical protein
MHLFNIFIFSVLVLETSSIFRAVFVLCRCSQRAPSFAKTISTEEGFITLTLRASELSASPTYAKAAQTHTKRRRLCVLYYCAAAEYNIPSS